MVKETLTWEAADGSIFKTKEEADFYEFSLAVGKVMNTNPASILPEQMKNLWRTRFTLAGYILGTYRLTEKKEILKND